MLLLITVIDACLDYMLGIEKETSQKKKNSTAQLRSCEVKEGDMNERVMTQLLHKINPTDI